MKKTFTINISGKLFHIEEDAFEKLHDYLQRLNHYFSNQPGGYEILQDIEARCAELVQEKITEQQEAVTDEWVEEVMARMGKPEDFMDSQRSAGAEYTGSETGVKLKKRLYRDTENRVLAGVCSGLGAYLNTDPVLLRILFVALVLMSVGIAVIIYLIMWMIVPKATTTAQRLEMRGEEPTIQNIQRSIQEEVNAVKDSFSKINQSESFREGKRATRKAFNAFRTGVTEAFSAKK
jgi:phage shock protein PspC (stress-responsive transcriptional regulator)